MTDLLTRTRTAAAPTPGTADEAVDDAAAGLVGSVAEHLVVLVAPSTGRFRRHGDAQTVEAGELVGHVTGGRGRADEVRAPVRAALRSLLVRPGQLVMRGQGLAWFARA